MISRRQTLTLFLATLPSLRLTDARIESALVMEHERMLTGGFYAELELEYDPAIAQQRKAPNWNAARGEILLRPGLPAGAYGYQPQPSWPNWR